MFTDVLKSYFESQIRSCLEQSVNVGRAQYDEQCEALPLESVPTLLSGFRVTGIFQVMPPFEWRDDTDEIFYNFGVTTEFVDNGKIRHASWNYTLHHMPDACSTFLEFDDSILFGGYDD